MSLFPIGLLIAITAFFVSVHHLNQTVSNYYDFVAFFMVMGGTAAVGVILVPWHLRRELFMSVKDLIHPQRMNYRLVINDCLETLKNHQPILNERSKESIHMILLRDGFEMLTLGVQVDKTERILMERLEQYVIRRKKIANTLRSLAKYPPAFGLMGTVLGLVNVMRGVSSGSDGKKTAMEMAIALVATMYGLIVANLLINPAGEAILQRINDEETFGQVAISTVLLFSQQTSMLESQEILNSYAPVEQRVSILHSIDGEMAA